MAHATHESSTFSPSPPGVRAHDEEPPCGPSKKGSGTTPSAWGVAPKHVVLTVDEFGNTSSTTHFIALWKYLTEGRFAKNDRVLLALAAGLEVGIIISKIDQLVNGHGHDH